MSSYSSFCKFSDSLKLRLDSRGRLSYRRRLAALSRLKSIENTLETLRQAQGFCVQTTEGGYPQT